MNRRKKLVQMKHILCKVVPKSTPPQLLAVQGHMVHVLSIIIIVFFLSLSSPAMKEENLGKKKKKKVSPSGKAKA